LGKIIRIPRKGGGLWNDSPLERRGFQTKQKKKDGTSLQTVPKGPLQGGKGKIHFRQKALNEGIIPGGKEGS